MRVVGIVKWFEKKLGYGFIEHPDGDVFVHYSVISEEGYRSLNEGQKVDYELLHGEKGMSAEDVRKISDGHHEFGGGGDETNDLS